MLTRIQIRVICEMGLLTVYNGSKYGGYQPTEWDTVYRKCTTFYSLIRSMTKHIRVHPPCHQHVPLTKDCKHLCGKVPTRCLFQLEE